MDEITVEYKIENVTATKVRRSGEFNGEVISALVDCIEVEMVPVDPSHSAVTLRFTGNQLAVAREKFVQGETISWPL